MSNDPFVIIGADGRRHWRAPADGSDPEPPKADETGNLSRAWASWERRRMEARQRGIAPDAKPAEPTWRESTIARYDALIQQAQEVVQRHARRRYAIRAEILEAERPSKGIITSGGIALMRVRGAGLAKRLRAESEALEIAMAKAKAIESQLRGDRNAMAAGGLPRDVEEELARIDSGDEGEYLVEFGQTPPAPQRHEVYPGDTSWPRRYFAWNPTPRKEPRE